MADMSKNPRRSYLTASQVLNEIENMSSSSDTESLSDQPLLEKKQRETSKENAPLYSSEQGSITDATDIETHKTQPASFSQDLFEESQKEIPVETDDDATPTLTFTDTGDLSFGQDSLLEESEAQLLMNLSVPTLEAMIQEMSNAPDKETPDVPIESIRCEDGKNAGVRENQLTLKKRSTNIDLVDEDAEFVSESRDPDSECLSHESLSEEDDPTPSTQMKRKRRKTKDPAAWKQNVPREKRLKGEAHKSRRGFEREDRILGPKCESNFCLKSKLRECKKFSDAQRVKIFSDFWSMGSWEERKRHVNALTSVSEKKQSKVARSSRGKPVSYFLKAEDGSRYQVCKAMFSSTLGIPPRTLGFWLSDTEKGNRSSDVQESTQDGNALECEQHEKPIYPGKKLTDSEIDFLKKWLDAIPVVESHYCRKNDAYKDKKFLEPGTKVSDLHKLYVQDANEKSIRAVGDTYFKQMFTKLGFSIFRPRKDQCDNCIAAKQGHINKELHDKHLAEKDKARNEKMKDKEKAAEDESFSVWTQDAQAVLLCPSTKASALYYRCKLQVHNFTTFNLTDKEGHCYLWDETNGGLKGEVFAYLIYNHFKNFLISKPNIKELILWSDGAMYQNKNAILSNALLQLSMETGVNIYQKYLVVGHTQMECDSMHSTIERSIKGDIFTPRDYAVVMQNARKTPGYVVHQLHFSDFKKMDKTRFSTIRPGKKKGDPTVNQISHLKYQPKGEILYKLFNSGPDAEWTVLPTRVSSIGTEEIQWQQFYANKLPITKKKFDDLQAMKKVMPIEAGLFYDSLPFE